MSSKDDKIDFSALDPSADTARWERMLREVHSRIAQRPALTIATQLRAWARPALAIAAAAAIIVCSAAFLEESPQKSDPASTLAQWAANDELPATSTIVEIFGAHHGE